MKHLKYFEMRSGKDSLNDQKKDILKNVIDWKFIQFIEDRLINFTDNEYEIKVYVVCKRKGYAVDFLLYADDEHSELSNYWVNPSLIRIGDLKKITKEDLLYKLYVYDTREDSGGKTYKINDEIYSKISNKCDRITSLRELKVKPKYD